MLLTDKQWQEINGLCDRIEAHATATRRLLDGAVDLFDGPTCAADIFDDVEPRKARSCEFVNPFDGQRCCREFPHRHVYEHQANGSGTWIEALS